MDESTLPEDGWQVQPMVHEQGDRKSGSQPFSCFNLLHRSSQRENSTEAVGLDVLGLSGHGAQCFFDKLEHDLFALLSQAHLTKK